MGFFCVFFFKGVARSVCHTLDVSHRLPPKWLPPPKLLCSSPAAFSNEHVWSKVWPQRRLHCSPSPRCCSLAPDFPPLIIFCSRLSFGVGCGRILWKWTMVTLEMVIHLCLAWSSLKEKDCGTTEQVFDICIKVPWRKSKRWDLKHGSDCQHVLFNRVTYGNLSLTTYDTDRHSISISAQYLGSLIWHKSKCELLPSAQIFTIWPTVTRPSVTPREFCPLSSLQ